MTGLKVAVFAALSVVMTVFIAGTIRPIGDGGTHTYTAIFSSASALEAGDQVRVAGVVVGRVSKVEVTDDARAAVALTASDDLQLTQGTRAQIRYLNLVGKRYIALQQGEGERLKPGDTITLANTEPALDLDLLFNGFKPLFKALSPDEVNGLAQDIVATLQGERGTVTDLLSHTASLTNTIADRDAVVGRLVDNLDTVLETLADRESGLSDLVLQLDRYVTGLAGDRDLIGSSLEQLDALAGDTAGLLRRVRAPLQADVKSLRQLADKLDRPTARRTFDRQLRRLPAKVTRASRVASYGSWFNFHACDVSLSFIPPKVLDGLPQGLVSLLGDLASGSVETVRLHDASERCQR